MSLIQKGLGGDARVARSEGEAARLIDADDDLQCRLGNPQGASELATG